jgi:hypothetical protein
MMEKPAFPCTPIFQGKVGDHPLPPMYTLQSANANLPHTLNLIWGSFFSNLPNKKESNDWQFGSEDLEIPKYILQHEST